jgi:hypothetical protein
MSTEPQPESGSGVSDDTDRQQTPGFPDPPDVSTDGPPSERRATAPWVRATDRSGALKATREMPEPDSLGG